MGKDTHLLNSINPTKRIPSKLFRPAFNQTYYYLKDVYWFENQDLWFPKEHDLIWYQNHIKLSIQFLLVTNYTTNIIGS